MKYSYAWKNLHALMLSMVGDGDIKSRLNNGIIAGFYRLESNDVPDSLKDELNSLQSVYKSIVAGDEGTIAKAVNSMNVIEAEKYAERLLSFYTEIVKLG